MDRRWLWPTMAGLLYFAVAAGSLAAIRGTGGLATIWPANGLLLAACLRSRAAETRRTFACGALASLFVNLAGGFEIARSLHFTLANVSAVAAAFAFVRRTCPSGVSFERLRDVGQFCLAAIAQAGIGALIAAPATGLAFGRCLALSASWFSTDLLGTLVVTPMVLTALSGRSGDAATDAGRTRREWATTIGLLLVVTTVTFAQSRYPALFLPLAVLQIAAHRLGVRGAATGVALVAVIGSIATAMGTGPVVLVQGDPTGKAVFMQFYLVVVFASALPLASLQAARLRLARRLERSERVHRSLIERSPAVIFETDAEGRWTFLSPAWTTLAGGAPEDALGADFADVFHPEDRSKAREALAPLYAGAVAESTLELRYRGPDGSDRWASLRCYANRDAAGAVIGAGGAMSDVSARVAIAHSLGQSERRYRLLAEYSTDIIFRLNRERRFLYISPAVKSVTGFAPHVLLGQDLLMVMHVDDRARAADSLEQLWLGQAAQVVVATRTRAADGTWHWLETKARTALHDGAVEVIGVSRDISDRKRFETELLAAREAAEAAERDARHLAETDALTGLASRRMFLQQLEKEIGFARSLKRPLAVAVFDVDHFKRINDRYGHATGDDVLRRVAVTVRGAVRDGDLVGRLGGEEFGILMPDTDLRVAAALGEQALGAVAAADGAVTNLPPVTISVGIAALVAEATTSTLIAAADAALYEAKRTGRNRLCCAA